MELEVCDLCVSYGEKDGHKALDNVSFTVGDGQFASILGESGAGKSTLLKVISGIVAQDAGEVLFDGACVDGLPTYKRNIGFLFQDFRLFPHMSVEENVAYPLRVRGIKKAKRSKVANDLLERVQLAGFGKRAVSSLSGGQAQRVALARALAAKPSVLFLDEPFSGLDESLRDDMRSLLLRLVREENLTTVMVTHDANEALRMSDKIVALANGQVKQADTPEELYHHPATKAIAACFGDCSTLAGSIEDGAFRIAHLRIPTHVGSSKSAFAVIRTVGCMLNSSSHDGLVSVGSAKVRCSTFGGAHWVVRLDLEGQTLSAFTSDPLAEGEEVDVCLDQEQVFIFDE